MTNLVEIGELREQVGKDMVITLRTIINRMSKHSEIYWILVHSSWDKGPMPSTPTNRQHIHPETFKVKPENVLRTNLIIMPVKPTHVLVGTLCFEVDNKRGKLDLLWNLPMDAPRPPGIEMEQDSEYESVFRSAKNSGVIAYG
ncbi:MAG TPA: hypothetical protein ENH94_00310 [Phycisphaerales bacterium]|nr:hypothetical protein [Phycisphaerales bacterium]